MADTSPPDVSAAPTRDAIEALVGRAVDDLALYTEALTHRSLTRGRETPSERSNERLEFLGDALLGAEVAEALFHRFADEGEGHLSRMRARLVSGQSLARCAERLGLGRHLRLSENADRSKARTSPTVLADAFEALIGAIHLDLGAGAARSFVKKHVLGPADFDALGGPGKNFKSRLQEHVQARRPVQPTYRLAKKEGPPHARTFTVEVLIDDAPLGAGTARSKKRAEQEAAREALHRLESEDGSTA